MEHGTTPTPKHDVLVWVDHHEARIVHPQHEGGGETARVHGDTDRPHERKHDGGHRHPISAAFADRIADAVRACSDLAITGPSTAKDELLSLLRERHEELAERVRAVEPFDHVTDAQLVTHARRLFERIDRMRGIHVS